MDVEVAGGCGMDAEEVLGFGMDAQEVSGSRMDEATSRTGMDAEVAGGSGMDAEEVLGFGMNSEHVLESGMDAEESIDICQDLIIMILAKLPLVSLLRSRSVCKAWRDVVSSQSFCHERLKLRAGEPERMLCIVESTAEFDVSCVYDPASNTWYKLESLSWLPALAASPVSRAQKIAFRVVSAGVGVLVKARCKKVGEARVMGSPHVGNPLARSWACLPALPTGLRMQDVRGLFVDARARCLKLVAVREIQQVYGNTNKPVPTFIFDSALGIWCERSSLLEVPEGISLHFGSNQGVFLGRVLYCLAGVRGNLLTYDLDHSRWSWLAVDMPPRTIMFVFKGLMKVRERLLCLTIGLLDFDPNALHEKLCVQVWELDFERMAWTVVADMSSSTIDKFWASALRGNPNLHTFEFLISHDITVVAGDDEVYVMQEYGDHMLALDLRRTPPAWRWLPAWPYNHCLVRKSVHCLDPWLQFGSWIRQQ